MSDRSAPSGPEESPFDEEEARLARELAEALDGAPSASPELEELTRTAALLSVHRHFELSEERRDELERRFEGAWAERAAAPASRTEPRGPGRTAKLLYLTVVPLAAAAVWAFSLGRMPSPEQPSAEVAVAARERASRGGSPQAPPEPGAEAFALRVAKASRAEPLVLEGDDWVPPEPPGELVRAQAEVLAEVTVGATRGGGAPSELLTAWDRRQSAYRSAWLDAVARGGPR